MAFLPQGQEQQQQGQQANQNQIPTVPVIPSLAGSGGPSAGQGAGTGVTNTASPAAAPSSPWQNVTSYLQANAGQAGQVADVIGGNLQNQYNQANQGIQNANTNFGQQIQSARVPLDQQLAQQAASNPSQVASDPSQVAAFQRMYNAQYGGPQSFSGSQDYSNLQAQVQKAQQQAALVNQGTPGLMTLLQQAESAGGKNPTQGVTALDSLLLQEDPSNFGKLASAAAPFAGLTDYLGQTQTGLDTAAQNAAKEAAATQSQLQNQFIGPGGVVPTLQAKENQQLQDLAKQSTAYNTNINDLLNQFQEGKPLTDQQLADLQIANTYGGGWNADNLKTLAGQGGLFSQAYNLGVLPISPGFLANYYTPQEMAKTPTMANAITPDEYANAQALNQLLGFDTGLAVQPSAYSLPQGLGSYDVGQAWNDLKNQFYGNTPQMRPDQMAIWNDLSQALNYPNGVPSTPVEQSPQPPVTATPPGYVPPPDQNPTAPHPNPTYPNPYGDLGYWDTTSGTWQKLGLA